MNAITTTIISTLITTAVQKGTIKMVDPNDDDSPLCDSITDSMGIFYMEHSDLIFTGTEHVADVVRFYICPEDDGYHFFVVGQKSCTVNKHEYTPFFDTSEKVDEIAPKTPLSVKILKDVLCTLYDLEYDEIVKFFQKTS